MHEQARARPDATFQQVWQPGLLGGKQEVTFGQFAEGVQSAADAVAPSGSNVAHGAAARTSGKS